MQTITEGTALPRQPSTPFFEASDRPYTPSVAIQTPNEMPQASRIASGASAMKSAGNAAQRARGLRRLQSGVSMRRQQSYAPDEYGSDVVDLLDLVGASPKL